MCYFTCVTCQNLHVYSQRYLLYTSFNSNSENLLFKQHFQLTPSLTLPYDGAGAGMRLMGYFTSLNHSLVRNIFGITAGFAGFG